MLWINRKNYPRPWRESVPSIKRGRGCVRACPVLDTGLAGPVPPLRAGAGFTLVELLTVIAIIAVLAGILMPALSSAMKKAYEGKARSAISALELAISMYETDMGYYPIVEGTTGVDGIDARNQKLVAALADRRYGNSARSGAGPGPRYDPSWRGPYMEFKAKDLRDPTDLSDVISIPEHPVNTDNEAVFVDPWDNPYVYIPYHKYGVASVKPRAAKPGKNPSGTDPCYNPTSYQIFSKGSDGETAGENTYRAGCTVPGNDTVTDNEKNNDDINNWD